MTNDHRFYNSIIPSANLFATAEEVSRFYQMLLNQGQWQGKTILEPLTVHQAVRPLGGFQFDRSLMLPMRYSAGFMLGGSPVVRIRAPRVRQYFWLGRPAAGYCSEPDEHRKTGAGTTHQTVDGADERNLL